MTRPLFDPRMATELGDFYPSLCSFQVSVDVIDPNTYEPTPGWIDVAGHVSLACAVAATSGQEVRRTDQTIVTNAFTISLPSDQSAIAETMRAVVTGPNAGNYNVLSVQVESTGLWSRCLVEVVT